MLIFLKLEPKRLKNFLFKNKLSNLYYSDHRHFSNKHGYKNILPIKNYLQTKTKNKILKISVLFFPEHQYFICTIVIHFFID